jgi:hypothetical protein
MTIEGPNSRQNIKPLLTYVSDSSGSMTISLKRTIWQVAVFHISITRQEQSLTISPQTI